MSSPLVGTFPMCCGAYTVYDFNDYNHLDDVKWKLDQINQAYNGIAFLIAILNEYQNPKMGPVLEEAGYKMLSEGYNGGSGRMLYLYVKIRPKPEMKAATRRW